jgi:hypothetical protein
MGDLQLEHCSHERDLGVWISNDLHDMEETSTIPECESQTDLWLCKKNNKQHQKYSNGANNLSHYRSRTSCIYFAGLGPSNCGQHQNIDRIQRCATKYILAWTTISLQCHLQRTTSTNRFNSIDLMARVLGQCTIIACLK